MVRPVTLLVLALSGCIAALPAVAPVAAKPAAPSIAPVQSVSAPEPPALAEVPAPPPYDLRVDIAAITARAKTELGDVQIAATQDVFVLIAAPGWNEASLAASESLTVSAIDAYLNGRFDKKPNHAIAVYLFPNAVGYQAYCKLALDSPCDSPFGAYYSNLNRIIMNAGPGLGTLTHELVHPLVEVDFPRAPTWLNEGLASLFEAPAIVRVGEIHGVSNWRLPRLLRGMATPDESNEARLDTLFGMTDATFRDDREKLHYATARYVCQWLDSKGALWRFYRGWRDHVDTDPTGEKSFTQALGMSPAQAEHVWKAWVTAISK